MEMHIDELLSKVTEFIQSEAKTDTIIGDAFELGEFRCVPVIKLGIGFGSGGGEGDAPKQAKGEGGMAGGGVGIEPLGFLVTTGSNISFISTEKHSALTSVFEKVPGLIEKLMEKKTEMA